MRRMQSRASPRGDQRWLPFPRHGDLEGHPWPALGRDRGPVASVDLLAR